MQTGRSGQKLCGQFLFYLAWKCERINLQGQDDPPHHRAVLIDPQEAGSLSL